MNLVWNGSTRAAAIYRLIKLTKGENKIIERCAGASGLSSAQSSRLYVGQMIPADAAEVQHNLIAASDTASSFREGTGETIHC